MTDQTHNTIRSSTRFNEDCAFARENLEAEALDILEPADHARMQRHLQLCGPCRRELAELHKVADLLPLLSEPATPSPLVKARLFQQIADESVPEAPVYSHANPWEQEHSPAPAPTTGGGRPGGSNGGWRSWMMSALVAPLAIAIIVLGAWTNSLRNDLQSAQSGERDTVAEIAQDTGNGGMKLYSMEPSCPDCDDTPATGHLGGNPDDNVGILVAWNLNPGERHEVWCEERDGTVIRVSDLQVEQSGEVFQTVSFPGAIGGYTTIYVTSESGTEEMRVAVSEDVESDIATPGGNGE